MSYGERSKLEQLRHTHKFDPSALELFMHIERALNAADRAAWFNNIQREARERWALDQAADPTDLMGYQADPFE